MPNEREFFVKGSVLKLHPNAIISEGTVGTAYYATLTRPTEDAEKRQPIPVAVKVFHPLDDTNRLMGWNPAKRIFIHNLYGKEKQYRKSDVYPYLSPVLVISN